MVRKWYSKSTALELGISFREPFGRTIAKASLERSRNANMDNIIDFPTSQFKKEPDSLDTQIAKENEKWALQKYQQLKKYLMVDKRNTGN